MNFYSFYFSLPKAIATFYKTWKEIYILILNNLKKMKYSNWKKKNYRKYLFFQKKKSWMNEWCSGWFSAVEGNQDWSCCCYQSEGIGVLSSESFRIRVPHDPLFYWLNYHRSCEDIQIFFCFSCWKHNILTATVKVFLRRDSFGNGEYRGMWLCFVL